MSERLIRLLRTRPAPADGVADADLLARWADRRDQAAFELLLRRHAEPVWRTCRAVAGEGAEDAFQATFLALARRAAAVRGNVPGWLHQVARHASLRAVRSVAGRAVPAVVLPDGGHGPTCDEPDFAALHAELARLPAAYRVPILLCYLHGRTQAQAAAELGLPLGTVATRVRRGCEKLKVALTRRGLAPVVGFGPPLVPPAALIPATLGVGLGATAARPAIHSLAHGAVSAMSRTRMKLLAAVAAVGCAVTGGAILAYQPPADPPPAKPAPQPVARWEPKPSDFFDRRADVGHMKQVVTAMHSFSDATGKLPADVAGKDGKLLLSWRVAILPYVDQELLYGLFKLDEPWDSPHNRPLLKHVPPVYRSAGAGPGLTRVKMFRGPHAALDPAGGRKLPQDFPDGTSNTVGVVDAGAAVEWSKPSDLDYAKERPLPDLSGPFTDGYSAGMMDGSAHWLDRRADEKFLRRLIERADATPIRWPELPPRPKRPLTAREKAEADRLHKILTTSPEIHWLPSLERLELAAELAKLGPLTPPPVPPADDLDGLQRAWEELFRRAEVDREEAARLMASLKAKDPKRAKELEEQHQQRWKKLHDATRKE